MIYLPVLIKGTKQKKTPVDVNIKKWRSARPVRRYWRMVMLKRIWRRAWRESLRSDQRLFYTAFNDRIMQMRTTIRVLQPLNGFLPPYLYLLPVFCMFAFSYFFALQPFNGIWSFFKYWYWYRYQSIGTKKCFFETQLVQAMNFFSFFEQTPAVYAHGPQAFMDTCIPHVSPACAWNSKPLLGVLLPQTHTPTAVWTGATVSGAASTANPGTITCPSNKIMAPSTLTSANAAICTLPRSDASRRFFPASSIRSCPTDSRVSPAPAVYSFRIRSVWIAPGFIFFWWYGGTKKHHTLAHNGQPDVWHVLVGAAMLDTCWLFPYTKELLTAGYAKQNWNDNDVMLIKTLLLAKTPLLSQASLRTKTPLRTKTFL